MTHKSDSFHLLKSFVLFAENQFSGKVKIVRSDNGSEFSNNEAQGFYNEKGILHQTTCYYTPQQNGIVERKHRHLLEMARSLYFQSCLPIKYWGECVLTAAYIINRIPSAVLKGRTPHEILFHIT